MAENELCVARVPILQGLSREEQLEVAQFVKPLSVSKGDIVSTPGQSESRLYVMHTGALKVVQTAANGQEQILRTVTEGDVVGERAFLTGHRSTDLVVAIEDSRMCVLNHSDLSALLRTYPNISAQMLRTLSDRLTSVERLLSSITSNDVAARVAAYLLDLPGKKDGKGFTVQLPMSKQNIAAYLGTTPETLSRRLAQFTADGLIEARGRRAIAILDCDGLENIATAV